MSESSFAAPTGLAGYSEKQLNNLSRAWSGVCEDYLCENTPEQMKELEKLGLVEMRAAPEQWPEAEYGYVMTDKGETVVKKYRQWLKPANDPSSATGGQK